MGYCAHVLLILRRSHENKQGSREGNGEESSRISAAAFALAFFLGEQVTKIVPPPRNIARSQVPLFKLCDLSSICYSEENNLVTLKLNTQVKPYCHTSQLIYVCRLEKNMSRVMSQNSLIPGANQTHYFPLERKQLGLSTRT